MREWIIAAAIIIFLAAVLLAKICIIIKSDGESLKVYLKILFIRKMLYPKKPKAKGKKQETPQQEQIASAEKKTKLTPKAILQKIDELSEVLTKLKSNLLRFFSHIVLKKGKINIVVSSEEAYDTAMNYAKISSAAYGAAGILNSLMKVKKLDLNVMPDFLKTQCSFDLYIEFYVRLIYNLTFVFSIGLLLFKNRKLIKKTIKQ